MSGSRRLLALALTPVAALAAAGAQPPAEAGAAAPRIETMVVARDGSVYGPKRVTAAATRVRASGRRCRVRAGLPLTALAALDRAGGPAFRTRGSCSSLYVFQVGRDREAGTGGWVYKVGTRAGTVGAGDPSGPFGDGRRLRTGRRVLWYWCVAAGRCQRTLALRLSSRDAAPGAAFSVRAISYDGEGRGRFEPSVSVAIAGSRAVTGADGLATLQAPSRMGRFRVRATARGLIPPFPEVLTAR